MTDFGLAKATGAEDLTHTGDIIGTVRYMAPERFQGAGDARADIYALGLTLYELLALRPAFDETDRASLIRQVTQEDPPRLRRLNRHVPPDLETIIHKAIARDPGRRYADGPGVLGRPAALRRRAADPGAAGLDDRAALPMGPAEPGAGGVARPGRRVAGGDDRRLDRRGGVVPQHRRGRPDRRPGRRTRRGSRRMTAQPAGRDPPDRRRRPAASRRGEPGRIASQPRPGAEGRGRLIHQGQRERPVERARPAAAPPRSPPIGAGLLRGVPPPRRRRSGPPGRPGRDPGARRADPRGPERGGQGARRAAPGRRACTTRPWPPGRTTWPCWSGSPRSGTGSAISTTVPTGQRPTRRIGRRSRSASGSRPRTRPSRGSGWRSRGRSMAWRSAANGVRAVAMRIAARWSCG